MSLDATVLLSKGFNNKQVSQIIKIDEYGLDLSCIDPSTPSEKLRIIKEKLKDNKYSDERKKAANALAISGHNPVELLVDIKEMSDRYMSVCYELLYKNYEIENLKKLDLPDFYDVAEAVLSGCKISLKCLEDPNIEHRNIKMGLKLAKEGIDISPYFSDSFSQERTYQILSVINNDKLIDVSALLDTSFDDKQSQVISNALIDNINLLSFCDHKFNNYQMSQIYRGLANGVDVTIFNKRRYSAKQMGVICSVLEYNKEISEHGGDPVDVKKILNSDYKCGLMNLIFMCMKDNVDTTPIENKDYDFGQAFTIIDGIYYGLDTSLYADPKYSGEEMRTIYNALILSDGNGYDIDMSFILDKSVSVKSKVKYLADLIGASYKDTDFNIKFDTLDDIIEEKKTDIDDYYLALRNNSEQETRLIGDLIFKGTTKDGKTVKVVYDTAPMPDVSLRRVDMFDINMSLASTYRYEIKTIASLVSFLDCNDDNRYIIKNLAQDKVIEKVDESEIGEYLYHFRRFYEKMTDYSVESIRDGHIRCFTVFDKLDELAKSFGPDIKKIMLSHDMCFPQTTVFAFKKDLCERYGYDHTDDELKAIFEWEVEKEYAWHVDDTFVASLYDESEKSLKKIYIYGSRNIKEKLERNFDIEFEDFRKVETDKEDIKEI